MYDVRDNSSAFLIKLTFIDFFIIEINSPKLEPYNVYFFKVLDKGHRRGSNVIVFLLLKRMNIE